MSIKSIGYSAHGDTERKPYFAVNEIRCGLRPDNPGQILGNKIIGVDSY